MKAPAPRFALDPSAIDPPSTIEPIACDTIAIPRRRSHVYNECARLRNPIHTGLAFATSLGFPDIALHGTLLSAKMGEIAIDRHDRNPENVRRLAV
jgi:acyl dehydratase